MKKDKIMIIVMIMIAPGMTALPTILVVVILAVAAVRNGRLAVNLTVPIKSIDEVAQGNIKIDDCLFIDYFYMNIMYFSHINSAWRGRGSSRGTSKTSATRSNATTKKTIGLASFSQTKQYLANPNRYMHIS